MKALSYKESIHLIHALKYGVITTGLLKALETFGEAGSNSENLCAKSIYKSIFEGNDLQTSFQNANPRLPDTLTKIIIASYLNSVMDYALEDTYHILADTRQLKYIDEELISLAEKYEQMSPSIICKGCFEREFLKLISKAKTENATVVELEQVGESFLYKYFVSTEVIQVKQLTHSLVYKSIWQNLDSACKSDGVLKTKSRTYKIEKGKLASFLVTENNNDVLRIVFKGHKKSTEQLNEPATNA